MSGSGEPVISRSSLDCLSAGEDRLRRGEAERLGSLEIDRKSNLVGSSTGMSAGFAILRSTATLGLLAGNIQSKRRPNDRSQHL